MTHSSVKGVKRSQPTKERTKTKPWTGIQNFWWNKTGIHPNLGHPLKPETRRRISEVKTRSINLSMNSIFAYFLGILEGDGCAFRSGYTIKVSPGLNEAFANECVSLFAAIGLRGRKYLRNGYKSYHDYWEVLTYSKALYDYLKSINIVIALGNDKTFMEAFWMGMFKAEGCLTPSRTPNVWQRLIISNTNKELMLWGESVFLNLGYHPRFYIVKPTRREYLTSYNLVLSKQEEVSRFLDKLNHLEIELADLHMEESLLKFSEARVVTVVETITEPEEAVVVEEEES